MVVETVLEKETDMVVAVVTMTMTRGTMIREGRAGYTFFLPLAPVYSFLLVLVNVYRPVITIAAVHVFLTSCHRPGTLLSQSPNFRVL